MNTIDLYDAPSKYRNAIRAALKAAGITLPSPGKRVEACGRCGGSGRFGPLVVHNGICFDCGGSGKAQRETPSLRLEGEACDLALATVAAAEAADREAQRVAEEAAAAAEAAQVKAAYAAAIALPGVADAVQVSDRLGRFHADVLRTVLAKGYASDKQLAIIAEGVAGLAKAATAPIGERVTIKGTIVGEYTKRSDYGDTRKVIVATADGWKVALTAGAPDLTKGAVVEVVATLEEGYGGTLNGMRPKGWKVQPAPAPAPVPLTEAQAVEAEERAEDAAIDYAREQGAGVD